MDIISLVLTICGLAISGAAYWKADDAKKAVQKALKKRNADEDLKRLRDLIVVMETAKEAVTPWVSGMPHDRSLGHGGVQNQIGVHGLRRQTRRRHRGCAGRIRCHSCGQSQIARCRPWGRRSSQHDRGDEATQSLGEESGQLPEAPHAADRHGRAPQNWG